MTQAEQNCRDRILKDTAGACRNCQRGFRRIGGGSWQGSGKDAKEI